MDTDVGDLIIIDLVSCFFVDLFGDVDRAVKKQRTAGFDRFGQCVLIDVVGSCPKKQVLQMKGKASEELFVLIPYKIVVSLFDDLDSKLIDIIADDMSEFFVGD